MQRGKIRTRPVVPEQVTAIISAIRPLSVMPRRGAPPFAKDKPITLLSGSNLLSLLEKHGRAARIDIAEARGLGA